MQDLNVQYERIFRKLSDYQRQWDDIAREVTDVEKKIQKKAEEKRRVLEEKGTALKKRRETIEGFQKTAKRFPFPVPSRINPRPWDIDFLAGLNVAIGSSMTNSADAARKLYIEACGQLLTVSREQRDLAAEERKIKSDAEWERNMQLKEWNEQKAALSKQVSQYLNSDEYSSFIAALRQVEARYWRLSDKEYPNDPVCIGWEKRALPIPKGLENLFTPGAEGLVDCTSAQISIPRQLDVHRGIVAVADYSDRTVNTVRDGIQHLVTNTLYHYYDVLDSICLVDPVRWNAGALGSLSDYIEKGNAVLSPTPDSPASVTEKLSAIHSKLNAQNRDDRRLLHLLILRNFPDGYNSEQIRIIESLCENAERYSLTVLLTCNTSNRRYSGNHTIEAFHQRFQTIPDEQPTFAWFRPILVLPPALVRKLTEERPTANLDNGYSRHVGLSGLPDYRKGQREIEGIPFSIDDNGTIHTLSFTQNHYATFISGLPRSGKTRLLQALVTGLIRQCHPDDIELWLIDFAQSGFNKFARELAPHIRYLIMDESPDLVYHIIDRIQEILVARSRIFKQNDWEKITEVPPTTYMPVMLVVIDELMVMSDIVTDPELSLNGNYREKLKKLMTLGPKYGIYFLFATQFFTEGIRVLSDAVKNGIPQAVAMKNATAEIIGTLGLKNPTDHEKQCMETLPVFHALTLQDRQGGTGRLLKSKVLNIGDFSELNGMIRAIKTSMEPKSRYDFTDSAAFVHKKPLILDGDTYQTYQQIRSLFRSHLDAHREKLSRISAFEVVFGTPLKIESIHPISIYRSLGENLLLFAAPEETATAAAVVLSYIESLRDQKMRSAIWATPENELYQTLPEAVSDETPVSVGIESVCRKIRQMREKLENGSAEPCCCILLGFERLIDEFRLLPSASALEKSSAQRPNSGVLYRRRESGEPDLQTLMRTAASGSPAHKTQAVIMAPEQQPTPMSNLYNAMDDLKFLLTYGPRQGCHFLMCFRKATEFISARLDSGLFRHKLIFQTGQSEIISLIGSANTKIVKALAPRTFCYIGDSQRLTFRPYLHPGIRWDGWEEQNGAAALHVTEEENYLL